MRENLKSFGQLFKKLLHFNSQLRNNIYQKPDLSVKKLS